MLRVELDRVTPMGVPVLTIVGRECMALIEAGSLADVAMRRD